MEFFLLGALVVAYFVALNQTGTVAVEVEVTK